MPRVYSDYGSMSSLRGDVPLVVKCTFDRSMRRITFASAQTCSYELLRTRVEECFSLAAQSFTISYTDDDAEITDITSDSDLTEAVSYFQAGDDLRKITLRVTIAVDYDGPSLSDTASLSSLDEYSSSRAQSRTNLADDPAGFGLPPEEDAMTVSSRDVTAPPQLARSDASATVQRRYVPDDLSLSGTDPEPEREPDPNVFQRLRHSDESNGSLPTERGAQWLREQNSYTLRTMLGIEPEPSVSDGTEDSYPESSRHRGTISEVESRSGDLALERSERGKWYYTYASDPSTSASASLSGAINQSVTEEPEQMQTSLAPKASQHGLAWLAAQQRRAPRPPVPPPRPSSSQASSTRPTSPPALPPRRSVINPADYLNIPPDVLPFVLAEGYVDTPDRVTDCSSCGIILDSIRYVCVTCGEKPSRPVGSPESPKTVIGASKGKARAISDPFGDEWEWVTNGGTHTYPPRDHRPSNESEWTNTDDYIRSPQRPGPAPYSQHVHTSFPTSRHPGSRGPGYPIHTNSSPSPRHLTSSPTSSPSSSSGSGFEQGYELCGGCIEVAGVVHAAESANLSVGGSAGGSSTTLVGYPASVNGGDGTVSRRRQRTGKRHAYIEKIWSAGCWKDIEQDAAFSCSHCNKTVDIKPHKCISCNNFSLCFECYSQVHDIHPIHAFSVIPVKSTKHVPQPTARFSIDSQDQPLQHQGILCSHCLQTIIGARFHCAVCPSVDICANCESAGLAPPDGGHGSSHIMIKIPYPLDKREVNDASRRALDLWDSRDGPALGVHRPRAGSVGSTQARTVIGSSVKELFQDHHILCRGCNVSIRGVRYQCATCPSLPSSYNLCFECERKSHMLHDPYHVFLKLTRPVDRPIESTGPVIPVVYSEPAGAGSQWSDPRAYLQFLDHQNALCDLCSSHIVGEWFHCITCGKDYCDECEALGGHLPTHIFAVFKSRVETQLLGAVTDLTLNAPPPIWPHDVYLS